MNTDFENKKPRVTVLLSSYNGEKFIDELIKSILNQINVDVNLVIRDDGSKDSTISILKEYSKLNNVSVNFADNIGVIESFLNLIDTAPETDFYALADQDDIWHEDKLKKAIEMLSASDKETALLYGANQNCVDINKNFLYLHFENDISDKLNIESVIFKNLVAGCTMVFNKKLLKILQEEKQSRAIAKLRMHDTWIILVALVKGKVFYDHRPCMDYRRHGNNATDGGIIIKEPIIKTYIRKINNFLFRNKKSTNYASKSASIMLKCFKKDLSNSEKENMNLLAHYGESILNKIKLLKKWELLKFSGDDKIILSAKVFLNRY